MLILARPGTNAAADATTGTSATANAAKNATAAATAAAVATLSAATLSGLQFRLSVFKVDKLLLIYDSFSI